MHHKVASPLPKVDPVPEAHTKFVPSLKSLILAEVLLPNAPWNAVNSPCHFASAAIVKTLLVLSVDLLKVKQNALVVLATSLAPVPDDLPPVALLWVFTNID